MISRSCSLLKRGNTKKTRANTLRLNYHSIGYKLSQQQSPPSPQQGQQPPQHNNNLQQQQPQEDKLKPQQQQEDKKKQPEGTSTEYCYTRVRQFDYPGFFCGLFIPKPQRDAVMAIRAFNIQTATIKDLINGRTQLGQIRLVWWKDMINKIYRNEGIPTEPVLEQLSEAIHKYKLTHAFFTKLLNARYNDLTVKQPKTMDEVEEYCESTCSSIYYLLLEVLGIKNTGADHVASHLGKAMGMVTLLRGMPHHIQARELYIPSELTIKHNISQEQVFRGELDEKFTECVYEFANKASNHLEWARAVKEIPKTANPVFLPAAYGDDFLYRIQKANFFAVEPSLLNYNLKTQLVVAKNYYLRKF